jgi:hypothetical protein
MGPEAKPPLRRDLARMLWQTAAILGALGLLYGGVKHRKGVQAFYFAGRALAADDKAAIGWLDKLGEMGPEAAPACRVVYRNIKEPWPKRRAAAALKRCAGTGALLALAQVEGLGSAAARELLDSLHYRDGDYPHAAEFCRRAYLAANDDAGKYGPASALAGCAGLPALLEFVGQVGIDSPAELVFANVLASRSVGGDAPEGVTVIEQDLSPPKPGSVGPNEKLVLSGQIGDYEVEVYHTWWETVWGSRDSTGKVTSGRSTGLENGHALVYRRTPNGKRVQVGGTGPCHFM